jgi:hypothetical protein
LLELPKEPLSWRPKALAALLADALPSLASDTALPGTVPPCSDTSASGGSFQSGSALAPAAMASS